ncbi:C2H2-type domain-containing protein, partial [Aphis craccivora]
IRGGLVQASMWYAKANNAKTPGYDETKEKSWLIYQDCKLCPFGCPNIIGVHEFFARSVFINFSAFLFSKIILNTTGSITNNAAL